MGKCADKKLSGDATTSKGADGDVKDSKGLWSRKIHRSVRRCDLDVRALLICLRERADEINR
jgi:hypothetical protein